MKKQIKTSVGLIIIIVVATISGTVAILCTKEERRLEEERQSFIEEWNEFYKQLESIDNNYSNEEKNKEDQESEYIENDKERNDFVYVSGYGYSFNYPEGAAIAHRSEDYFQKGKKVSIAIEGISIEYDKNNDFFPEYEAIYHELIDNTEGFNAYQLKSSLNEKSEYSLSRAEIKEVGGNSVVVVNYVQGVFSETYHVLFSDYILTFNYHLGPPGDKDQINQYREYIEGIIRSLKFGDNNR